MRYPPLEQELPLELEGDFEGDFEEDFEGYFETDFEHDEAWLGEGSDFEAADLEALEELVDPELEGLDPEALTDEVIDEILWGQELGDGEEERGRLAGGRFVRVRRPGARWAQLAKMRWRPVKKWVRPKPKRKPPMMPPQAGAGMGGMGAMAGEPARPYGGNAAASEPFDSGVEEPGADMAGADPGDPGMDVGDGDDAGADPGDMATAGGDDGDAARDGAQDAEFTRWVQDALNRALGTRLPVSGVMDHATRRAVRYFQSQRGVPASGFVGPDTEAELEGGAATAPSAARSFQYRLSCPHAHHRRPFAQAHRLAVRVAQEAARRLSAPLLDAEATRLFIYFFGTRPETHIPWAGRSAGALVAHRFKKVADELGGGRRFTFTCISGATGDCSSLPFAVTIGKSAVTLCDPFWGRSVSDMAGTILHEAMHAVYGELFFHAVGSGIAECRRDNPRCYQGFALRLSGHGASRGVRDGCRRTPAQCRRLP
jgi:hypothetical protein